MSSVTVGVSAEKSTADDSDKPSSSDDNCDDSSDTKPSSSDAEPSSSDVSHASRHVNRASHIEYKQGMTGFVELHSDKAVKYTLMDKLYWLREHNILSYLYPYRHSNIIQYNSCCYVKRNTKNTNKEKFYYELTFDRYAGTLGEWLIGNDRDVLQIMIDLTSALDLCHKLSIWHRDVKLSNVLLSDSASDHDSGSVGNIRATLIDFTHSIRIPDYSAGNVKLCQYIATYSHRAPEIFKYQKKLVNKYNEKIDIWALGVVFYEIVTNSLLINQIGDSSEKEVCYFYIGEHQSDVKQSNAKQSNAKKSDVIHERTPNSYISAIREWYFKFSTKLKHQIKYWSWIEKMLEEDPAKRISASDLLNEMFKFAAFADISIKSPTHIVDENLVNKLRKAGKLPAVAMPAILSTVANSNQATSHITTEIGNRQQTDLMAAAVEDLKLYKEVLDMQFSVEKTIPVVEYLIKHKTIMSNNCRAAVLSLCLCIDTIVYDDVSDISTLLELLFERASIVIKTTEIHNEIVELLQKHEEYIFVLDKFEL